MNETGPLRIIDSGASEHYLKINSLVINIWEINDGANVTLLTGTQIKATHHGNIPVTNLSPSARSCNIFPGLTQYALVSVAQLCNNYCDVFFKKRYVIVAKQNKIL